MTSFYDEILHFDNLQMTSFYDEILHFYNIMLLFFKSHTDVVIQMIVLKVEKKS